MRLNPYLTNGFSHRYHLDESTFVFRSVWSVYIYIYIYIYIGRKNEMKQQATIYFEQKSIIAVNFSRHSENI